MKDRVGLVMGLLNLSGKCAINTMLMYERSLGFRVASVSRLPSRSSPKRGDNQESRVCFRK